MGEYNEGYNKAVSDILKLFGRWARNTFMYPETEWVKTKHSGGIISRHMKPTGKYHWNVYKEYVDKLREKINRLKR